MELVEQLMCFGLTRQEANLYLLLVIEGEATGYEAAKHTGISRSNTYTALAGLVEKGAAYLIEGNVTKYVPVPDEEFCDNKLKALSKIKKAIIENMPDKKKETEGYITITGEEHILDKMRNMIANAKERVYLSTSAAILQMVEPNLEILIQDGIQVVIFAEIDYHLKGATVYHRNGETNREQAQIRLIIDSIKVLTGEVTKDQNCTCLYSKNKNLIDIFKEMLKNEIKLIQIQNQNKGE